MSKVIKLDTENVFKERIPLEIIKKIWNDEDEIYTDDQLEKMREFAYLIMETVIKIAKKRKLNNVIELNITTNESTESHFIHPCEYRRAS
jgi:Na+/pantothenate symporter